MTYTDVYSWYNQSHRPHYNTRQARRMVAMVTEESVADVLRDLVARLGLAEMAQFLVEHSFELEKNEKIKLINPLSCLNKIN